jgi:cysteine desulfurase
MKNKVYLDYNSTTPIKPEVIDNMSKVMAETGNASSIHGFGQAARHHVENARKAVGDMVRVESTQVIFTSGATESNNSVLQGFSGQRVLAGATDHPAVLDVLDNAERIPVLSSGLIDMDALGRMLDDAEGPALVSIMLVNNETGVVQPLADIARFIKKKHRAVFIHTDAAQAPGRIDIDMPSYQIDYMSLSSHKFGGPQGVGALIVTPGAKPVPLLRGGGQEKRQRSGTENVAGIAGMGVAASMAADDLAKASDFAALRDGAESRILEAIPDAKIFGRDVQRISNTINVALPGAEAQTQLMSLDLAGVAVSNGSACSSGKVTASHVLEAMGADESLSGSAIRMSFGWKTTKADIDQFVDAWIRMAKRLAAQ